MAKKIQIKILSNKIFNKIQCNNNQNSLLKKKQQRKIINRVYKSIKPLKIKNNNKRKQKKHKINKSDKK